MDIEEENVKVVVRIRPMQTEEKKSGDVPCVKAGNDGREVQVKVGPLDAQVYRCNHCFNPETNQVDFFHESGITDLLDSAIQGYRACAFAFGQTGAGKTHTMIGSAKGISSRDKNVGLVPRSLDYLYEKLNQLNLKYKIKLSCLEIYHEHVYDLFAEDKERTPMAVREHNVEGFFLEGARLVDCSNYNIACNVLDVAFKNRQVGFHDLNSRSSRSHCMTEIYIETFPDPDGNPEQVVRGKMSLVDLAGSERLKSTNSTGKVLQEAGFINRSLYVLGKVIAGLVRTNGDLNHKDVPYRDSKLTKLLISSLGGSSRTLMISCVSEAKGSQAETLRTLKFSMSCARIRNKPIKFLDPQEKLIVDLKDEIKRLRQENQRLRSTLVTAPTSTDSMHSLIGGEDMSPSRMRASSANSSVSPTRRRISPEKMRKAAGGPGMSKKRTNAVAGVGGQGGRKTKNTKNTKKKPDIFYKYPQLERILGDDDSIESFMGSPKRGRLRPSKGAREDNTKGRVSDGGGESHMSASEAIMMGDTEEGHDDGNHSVHSLNSHGGGPRRMRPEVLDEMVHRRAPGPMILKDVQHAPYEPLRDSRLNKYYPAENHIKSMDQKKIDVLEQRIAKMEAQQQRLERLQAAGKAGAADGGATAAAAAAGDDDGADDYASYEDEFAEAEEPHGHGPHHPPVQGIPPSNAYDDDATIQNSIAIDGSELVKAGKHKGGAAGGPKKTQKKKKEKGVSPYIAHLGANKIQKFQQALDEKPRKAVESVPPASSKIAAGKPKAAPTAPPKAKAAALSSAPVSQERKEAHSVAMVRQSIDQELEELGLSEILGKPSSHMPSQADFANVISAATKKPAGAVAQSKSTPQIDHAAKKHPPTNNSNGNGNGSGSGNTSNTKQTTGGPNKSQSLPQIQSKQQQVDGGALVHAANTRKRGSRDAGDTTTTEKLPPIKAAASTTATNVAAAGAKKTAATDDNVQKPAPVAAAARASSASSPAGKKPAAVQNSPATAAKAGSAAAGSAKKASSSSPTKKSIDASHEANYDEEDDDDDFMPPTPDRLKEKLHALEASLVSKRIEMEDNPGDVTNEIEEKFKNLQLETLVIKQQLSELAGEAFPAGDSDKQAMGPGKSPVRPPPGPTASSADTAEEEENYEDDYYGEDDFENDDAGAGGSPKRPRTRGSPAKHVEETNDAEATVDDAVAAVVTVSVAAVVASPAAVSPVSPVAVKSPSATAASEKTSASLSTSPSSKIAPKTEEEVSSKVVASPVAAAPVAVGSTKSSSPPPPAAAVEARSAPDTAANGDEEDNYEDEYDVDFEADDDKAPSRAASPSKSKKSSPTRTSSSSVPVGSTEDQQQSTPTSVVQTDKAMMSSPVTKAANDTTTAPAEVEAAAPVAPPSSSPPPRRAKTPAKTPADDDYDAYAEDGFDDFDVSFNEDN